MNSTTCLPYLGQGEALNEVVPNIRNWDLCSKAEPRLEQAITDEALIIVNGLMVVKNLGAPAAIALREQETVGPNIELQTWYMPAATDRREAIREAFFRGKTHLELPGVTRWVSIKKVDTQWLRPGEDITEKARRVTMNLKAGTPMPNGLSRRAYIEIGDPFSDVVEEE